MSEAEDPRPRYVRFVKWTAIALAALLVLVVGAIASLPLVINTGIGHRFVGQIGSRALGQPVTVTGPIKLSLFPVVLKAQRVTIGSQHQDRQTISMKSATVKLETWPLFLGNLRPYYVLLNSPLLSLTHTRATNEWEKFFKTADAHISQRHPTIAMEHLNLKGIDVKDGTISYSNARTHTNVSITHLSFYASHVRVSREFPVRLLFQVSSGPDYHAVVVYRGNAELGAGLRRFVLSNTTIAGKLVSQKLSKGSHPFRITWKNLHYDRLRGALVAKRVSYLFQDLSGTLSLHAHNLGKSAPEVAGHIRTSQFSPRTALRLVRRTISSQLQGFNHFQLEGDFALKPHALSVSNLVVKLDQSTITGSVGLPFDSGPVHFALRVNQIDLNHYLPKWAGPAKHLTTAHGTKFLNAEVPGRLLGKLHMTGTLHISKLSGFGLLAGDVTATVEANKSKVRLREVTARVYGGHYAGDVTVSRAGQGVLIRTVQDVSNVQAEPLIYALTGTHRLAGTIDGAHIAISAGGDSVGELMATARGTIRFRVKDGFVHGFDLWESLQTAYLKRQRPQLGARRSSNRQTPFTVVDGQGTVSNGILRLSAIFARLPHAELHGQARLDLNHGQVEGTLLVDVNGRSRREQITPHGLAGLQIPVEIKGYFSALRVLPKLSKAPPP